MFFVRLLLWIITLPFVIVAHVLKLILYLLTCFGSLVTTLIGGVLFIASGVMLIASFWYTGEDFWNGFGTGIAGLLLGAFIYYLPHIGAFLIALLQNFIDWCHSISL